MTTLAQLKDKYSGQTVPEWELEKLRAEAKQPEPAPRKKKKDEPVDNGDSDAD